MIIGFVGDQYKTSCEVIVLQNEKKKSHTQAEQDLKLRCESIFGFFLFH